MRVVAHIVIAALFAACSEGKAFRDNGDIERIPDSHFDPNTANSEPGKDDKIFHSTYRFTVSMKRMGRVLCEGTSDLIGYADFRTENVGEIDCLGGKKLNLNEMMDGEMLRPSEDQRRVLAHFGMVDRIAKKGQTKYFPPLPYTLGPVIQNPHEYVGFGFSEDMVVEHFDPNGKLQSSSGVVSINVISAGKPFQPEGYPETFREVLHWERTVDGFVGVDRGDAFLYDKFEYWWNIRPIAIPRMRIEGPLGNFLPELNGVGSLLGVTLVVDMVLIDHRQL